MHFPRRRERMALLNRRKAFFPPAAKRFFYPINSRPSGERRARACLRWACCSFEFSGCSSWIKCDRAPVSFVLKSRCDAGSQFPSTVVNLIAMRTDIPDWLCSPKGNSCFVFFLFFYSFYLSSSFSLTLRLIQLADETVEWYLKLFRSDLSRT